eukprot:4778469-Prymnesium_polylepis.2
MGPNGRFQAVSSQWCPFLLDPECIKHQTQRQSTRRRAPDMRDQAFRFDTFAFPVNLCVLA